MTQSFYCCCEPICGSVQTFYIKPRTGNDTPQENRAKGRNNTKIYTYIQIFSVCTCMCLCACLAMRLCPHVCACLCVCQHKCAHLSVCLFQCRCSHASVCVPVCAYAFGCMCSVPMCMHVSCVWVYVNLHACFYLSVCNVHVNQRTDQRQ